MKKKIAIIGFGYVGKAAYNMVKDHYETIIFDPYPASIGELPIVQIWPENNFADCELAIICVPTSMDEQTKKCDTSIVEGSVKKLEAKLILIKSTVTPGTVDKLKKETAKRIIFSPEYIGESTYEHPYDFQTNMAKTPFLILGGDKQDTSAVLDLLVPILGPKKTYYQVSAKEAEVIKYMENSYFGVKIIFANEMSRICIPCS